MSYLNEFDATMQVIQGKWKIYLLYEIFDNEVVRFNELSRTIGRISNKILTNQLRELEQDGLVERIVYPEVPPKVEYRLTARGLSIIPVLDVICQWGLGNTDADLLEEVLCDDN